MGCEHTNRCSGHCCRRFYLPLTHEEIRSEVAKLDAGDKSIYGEVELRKVAEMVIPLELAKDAKEDIDGSPPPHNGQYFTCKHHDAATGNCLNYEARPNVCRDYPFYNRGYNARCRYKDCTWEEARNPPVPVNRVTLMRRVPLVSKLTHDRYAKYAADGECTKVAASK